MRGTTERRADSVKFKIEKERDSQHEQVGGCGHHRNRTKEYLKTLQEPSHSTVTPDGPDRVYDEKKGPPSVPPSPTQCEGTCEKK